MIASLTAQLADLMDSYPTGWHATLPDDQIVAAIAARNALRGEIFAAAGDAEFVVLRRQWNLEGKEPWYLNSVQAYKEYVKLRDNPPSPFVPRGFRVMHGMTF